MYEHGVTQLAHGSNETPRVINAVILKSEASAVDGEVKTLIWITVKAFRPVVTLFDLSLYVFSLGGKPSMAKLKSLFSTVAHTATGELAKADLDDALFLNIGSSTAVNSRPFGIRWPTVRVVAQPCRASLRKRY